MSCDKYLGYRNAFLKDSAFLSDAILAIDESGAKICLVVDLNGILMGTVTDGDARRAIIQG